MTVMLRSAVVSAVLVLGSLEIAAGPAIAQDDSPKAAPRWVLGGTAFFQPGAESFTERFERPAAGRTLSIETAFDSRSSFGLDGSLGVRLARGFGIGGSLSFYAPAEDRDAGGDVTARIPHPYNTNVDRNVAAAAGLKRSERGVHLSLLYFVRPSPKIQVVVGAGPSFFRASQTFVTDLEYSEDTVAAPSTVTIDAIHRRSVPASGTGFNAHLDLIWVLDDAFGIGGLVRYARATLPFEPDGRAVDAKAGGFQAGVGVRFLF